MKAEEDLYTCFPGQFLSHYWINTYREANTESPQVINWHWAFTRGAEKCEVYVHELEKNTESFNLAERKLADEVPMSKYKVCMWEKKL